MRKKIMRLMLTAVIVGMATDVAFAGFLPTPFEFSFFSSALNALFFLPLTLAGCG